ncbi:MAG: ABC transporter ATP-binding protein [bacterium]|nr:ABC transporter ATP-binding protein [bacterium]
MLGMKLIGVKQKIKDYLRVLREINSNTLRTAKITWNERKGSIIILLALVLAAAVLPFAQSGLSGLLINELIKNIAIGSIQYPLLVLVAAVVAIGFVFPFLRSFQDYIGFSFYLFIEEKFEFILLKKRGDMDIAVHEDPKMNDLLNKIKENGIWRVRNFIDRQFFIFQNVIEVAVASAVLIMSQWWILAIIFIGTLPELITEIRYGQKVWGIHTGRAELRRKYWGLQSHFLSLSSLIELKIFQNVGRFLFLVKELFRDFQNEQKINEKKRLLSVVVSLFFSQGVLAFATVWFVLDVIHGRLQVGTLTFILASIVGLRESFSSLFMNLGRQYQDNLFVSDVFKLLDVQPVLKKPKEGVALSLDKTPEIIFDNITFAYPGTGKNILKDFSLKISPGEKVALVGVNGAGKTTLIKLLCRFYDPDKGRVLVGGYDLRNIDIESWYHQLGIIFQDYSNYHFIVKEAIAVGRTGVDDSLEKIKEAAKASEADIFIEEWEKGYEQMLGKNFTEGVEPSIGQWQKLALARTFYRDPRILVLDEPTSSIDAEAEAKIFDQLESLPKDRTVILISHRFSTVRHSDKIAVMENGIVKELGSHEELLKLNGTYARLFSLQAKGYR